MGKFAREYLGKSWKKYIYIVICLFILLLPLALKSVEIKELLYSFYLGIFCLLAYILVDFIGQYRRYRAIVNTLEHVEVSLESLPEAVNLVEESYGELLNELFRKYIDLDKKSKTTREELVEFVTLWTHQVKTPLTALQLQAQELEEPQRSLLGGRLFEIEQYCDMILQYLRMEGTGTDYEFSSYNVRAMVNQSVKYFMRTFISKGISVKVDIPEETSLVTDEKWLVFALKQIISNALKYTEAGTVTIDMPRAGSIRITDTGIGISAEDLPRIFERGYTGYNGRRDKKATGIGLFLVKSIMDRLNGQVQVESEPGVGTSVTLNLTKL